MSTTTTPTPFIAFSSDDADRAHTEWGANCGPASLAACLGLTPDAVRPHLGDFEARGYLNPTMMANALHSLGFVHRSADPRSILPLHGLCRVQWGGPWLHPGVPPRAAYGKTHWVACKRDVATLWIFDINSGWTSLKQWERETVPRIVAAIKRADGSWSFTHRWEVRRIMETSQ